MQIIERHPITTAPVEVELTLAEVGVQRVFESFLADGLSLSDALIALHTAARRVAPNVAEQVLTPVFCDWLMS